MGGGVLMSYIPNPSVLSLKKNLTESVFGNLYLFTIVDVERVLK
jgi:hypothetical protein